MRGLANPVRIALVEALSLSGPLTATEAGSRIGKSPTTCSFHLRQLARYGLVEETGEHRGRSRPWRMRHLGMTIAPPADDPAAEIAANALSRLLLERQLSRYQSWVESRASYPSGWRRSAGESEYLLYLTPEELHQLEEEITSMLLPRVRERLGDPSQRPPGSLPVEILFLSYPIAPPEPQE